MTKDTHNPINQSKPEVKLFNFESLFIHSQTKKKTLIGF